MAIAIKKIEINKGEKVTKFYIKPLNLFEKMNTEPNEYYQKRIKQDLIR